MVLRIYPLFLKQRRLNISSVLATNFQFVKIYRTSFFRQLDMHLFLFIGIVAIVLGNFTIHLRAFKNEQFSASSSPTDGIVKKNIGNLSVPANASSKVEQLSRNKSEAQNKKFKIPSQEFSRIDFKNFKYPYQVSPEKKVKLPLKNGVYEYDFTDERGWFSLRDVYYVDLTNDGKQEAIVILSHIACGASCDGGAELFYLYTVKQNGLKLLWQFETGSLAYGCGLKSVSVKNRKIVLGLFGRCSDGVTNSSLMGRKYYVKGITRLTFSFNGRRFVEKRRKFAPFPERRVSNYSPKISIN